MLAQSFEAREIPAAAKVLVAFGGLTAPIHARYMAAWLIGSLQAAGSSVSWILEPVPAGPAGELTRIELAGARLRIHLTSTAGRLRIEADGLARCANLPSATEYSLLREELRIERPDAVFERTLARAKVL